LTDFDALGVSPPVNLTNNSAKIFEDRQKIAFKACIFGNGALLTVARERECSPLAKTVASATLVCSLI